jgi:ABC-type enterobactin transport system permease subunit
MLSGQLQLRQTVARGASNKSHRLAVLQLRLPIVITAIVLAEILVIKQKIYHTISA